jgi:hypothetical protein
MLFQKIITLLVSACISLVESNLLHLLVVHLTTAPRHTTVDVDSHVEAVTVLFVHCHGVMAFDAIDRHPFILRGGKGIR